MTSLYNQDQYAKHARLQTRTVKLHALFQTMPNTLTYKASISKYSPTPHLQINTHGHPIG